MKEVWFFLEEDADYDNGKLIRIGDFDSFEEAWDEYENHLSWRRKAMTPVMKGYIKEYYEREE